MTNELEKQNKSMARPLFVPLCVALSVSIGVAPFAKAAPGDVNSVNDGRNINSGTYYNTSGGKTEFRNSTGGGLYLKSGDFVRGIEVDAGKNATGNGGHIHFNAAGQVVRLDGNVDVSGLIKNGAYTGNGGKVTIDAGFLYQNGSIFANGVNGGAVFMNVGAATMGSSSRIYAKGFGDGAGNGGAGGVINVKGAGAIDIKQGAIMDTSGKVVANYDTNVIDIQGGLVNNAGIMRANAIAGVDNTVVDVDAANPGAESGLQLAFVPNANGSSGGKIKLVATGTCTDCVDSVLDYRNDNIISKAEADALKTRNNELKANHDADVVNTSTGVLQANGSDASCTDCAGDGGSIFALAADDVYNSGLAEAKGGKGIDYAPRSHGANGGTIELNAYGSIYNSSTGLFAADGGDGGNTVAGDGGHGGKITLKYAGQMVNDGLIRANGGKGGSGASDYVENSHYGAPGESVVVESWAWGEKGGKGGNGGIVEFCPVDAAGNPIGTGKVVVNGGAGGVGGDAIAKAAAVAIDATNWDPNAKAVAAAYAGEGGEGGQAGVIKTVNPADFKMNYEAKAGIKGEAGYAESKAVAVAIDNAEAYTDIYGREGSNSEAIATSFEMPDHDVTWKVDETHTAIGIKDGSIFNKSAAQIEQGIKTVNPDAQVGSVTLKWTPNLVDGSLDTLPNTITDQIAVGNADTAYLKACAGIEKPPEPPTSNTPVDCADCSPLPELPPHVVVECPPPPPPPPPPPVNPPPPQVVVFPQNTFFPAFILPPPPANAVIALAPGAPLVATQPEGPVAALSNAPGPSGSPEAPTAMMAQPGPDNKPQVKRAKMVRGYW